MRFPRVFRAKYLCRTTIFNPSDCFARSQVIFKQQQNLFSVHQLLLQCVTAHSLQHFSTDTFRQAKLTFYWQASDSCSGFCNHLLRSSERQLLAIISEEFPLQAAVISECTGWFFSQAQTWTHDEPENILYSCWVQTECPLYHIDVKISTWCCGTSVPFINTLFSHFTLDAIPRLDKLLQVTLIT